MYYTDAMRRAFHNLKAPKGLDVMILDNEDFLVVKVDELSFMKLDDFGKRRSVEYLIKLKNALEDEGAYVLIVRDPVEE
jgi:hypothetical protein